MKWDKKKQKEWDLIHNRLQKVLLSEIEIRQQILSNLHQQEYILLIGDFELKEELHQECNRIAKKLKTKAKERNLLVRRLMTFLPQKSSSYSIDFLFDSEKKMDEETCLLYQKLQLLVEKTYAQKIRNKTLYALIQKEGTLSVDNSALHTQPVYLEGKEKKPFLITIDYPEKPIDFEDDTSS